MEADKKQEEREINTELKKENKEIREIKETKETAEKDPAVSEKAEVREPAKEVPEKALEKKGASKKAAKKAKEKPSKVRIAVLVLLGILTVVSGFYYYNLVVKYKNIPPRVIYQEEKREREIIKENITLYVPSETNETLVKKQREIIVGSSQEERVKNILLTLKDELGYTLKYTDEGGKIVEIPFLKSEVQLLDVYFDGSDIYLNMNYHFRDNMKIISQEIFIIYSIVNTLTEDSRYKRVKFLINDREVEQLNFYKLSDFYERNLEI